MFSSIGPAGEQNAAQRPSLGGAVTKAKPPSSRALPRRASPSSKHSTLPPVSASTVAVNYYTWHCKACVWKGAMGQEFHVVRCFSCAAFQTHQVRKDKKFVCKLCGEKQSVRKEYGRGSGKDCRVHVQKLNTMRRSLEEEQEAVLEAALEEECSGQTPGHLAGEESVEEAAASDSTEGAAAGVGGGRVSKWSKYLSSDSEEDDLPGVEEATVMAATASRWRHV